MEELSADIGWLSATQGQTERLLEMKYLDLLCNFLCTRSQFPRLFVHMYNIQEMHLNKYLQISIRRVHLVKANFFNDLKSEQDRGSWQPKNEKETCKDK